MPILQLSAPELKTLIGGEQPLELVDVRTAEECAIATIGRARLLDQEYYQELLTRDRDTLIVFQCHHGIRSQSAAEQFQAAGFRNLYNLQGGIDAWSRLVDPSVPRY
ncbi:MAG: rhodanese-like domain-containing protein [Acidobacteriota bacterium]|nr:rhodanese-like domain-containing protein [Acidobacteriota bacterium]